jgi:hypothetical protein
MYLNPGIVAGVIPLTPNGTNSTMFTMCCETAICDDERLCPQCKRNVIGYDSESDHERGEIRWRFATAHWKKRKR